MNIFNHSSQVCSSIIMDTTYKETILKKMFLLSAPKHQKEFSLNTAAADNCEFKRHATGYKYPIK